MPCVLTPITFPHNNGTYSYLLPVFMPWLLKRSCFRWQIVSSEVSGAIEANSRLSGIPDMLLVFQDPSVSRHTPLEIAFDGDVDPFRNKSLFGSFLQLDGSAVWLSILML